MSKELVDRVMACGVGEKRLICGETFYYAEKQNPRGRAILPSTIEAFINDGRVVLAMMEKCLDTPFDIDLVMAETRDIGKSLGPAILEACCDALEAK